MTSVADHTLRRAVWLVVVLNLAYFWIEFVVAPAIGSVSLFADSIDFLEDTSINFLILVALGWTARKRARRHGASGHPAHAWSRHAMDRMGEIQPAGRT